MLRLFPTAKRKQTSIERRSARRRAQFRLSSLLVAMTFCALLLAVWTSVLPRYVHGVRIYAGQLLVHMTPAGERLFGPRSALGPEHEMKVFLLSSLLRDAATFVVAALLVGWVGRLVYRRSITVRPTRWSSGVSLFVPGRRPD